MIGLKIDKCLGGKAIAAVRVSLSLRETPLGGPHRSGSGRKTDFGSQREFQWQMIHWVVGFHKM